MREKESKQLVYHGKYHACAEFIFDFMTVWMTNKYNLNTVHNSRGSIILWPIQHDNFFIFQYTGVKA